uniref:Uncharacterized protein n=1 Tax=Anopheles dirus TaxID=7168 RepID=A0A182N7X4_9DIPT
MVHSATLWSILLVATCSLLAVVESREVVCYYGSWAAGRTGYATFTPDDINPSLCTQLNYAFLDIESNGTLKNGFNTNTIAKFNDLKKKNPALKTLAAVGGWNAGKSFKTVAANAQLRTTFAKNAVAFLQKYRFDGMDIDWEYPAQADMANFVLFLKELANAFAPYKYLLTVAVPGPETATSVAYDARAISSIVSFINLMTYDMQGDFGVARHHAALYPGSAAVDDTYFKRQLNAEACVKFWINKGAQASKLTLGVPFYGRSYKLANPKMDGVGVPVTGPAAARPYTAEAGTMAYHEMCTSVGYKRQYDSVQGAAIVSGNGEWVSYDSVQSITQKCNLISQYGLGGGMVWAIDLDDITGACGPKFVLLTALNNCVNVNTSGATTTTAKPGAATTVKAVTSAPGTFVCTRDGYFRDPSNCGKYYRCLSGYKYEFNCPSGLYFSEANTACDYPANVKC